MGWMALAMVIGSLLLLAALAGGVYFAVRVARPRRELETSDSARALLDRRLATGEIAPEEYYERESALRSAEPLGSRRR